MFTNNPNATPIWLLMIFGAVAAFVPPRVKSIVSKYVVDNDRQSLYTTIIMMVILVVIVTLSVLIV